MNCYVYEYFILDTDEVFYVGKGKNKRYLDVWNRGANFREVLRKNNCSVRFYKKNLENKEALKIEKERIEELKQIGQASCNHGHKEWAEKNMKKIALFKDGVLVYEFPSQTEATKYCEDNRIMGPVTATVLIRTGKESVKPSRLPNKGIPAQPGYRFEKIN